MALPKIFSESILIAVLVVILIIIISLIWTFIKAKVTALAAPPSKPIDVVIVNPGTIQNQQQPAPKQ